MKLSLTVAYMIRVSYIIITVCNLLINGQKEQKLRKKIEIPLLQELHMDENNENDCLYFHYYICQLCVTLDVMATWLLVKYFENFVSYP